MRVRFRTDRDNSHYDGFTATFTAEGKPSKVTPVPSDKPSNANDLSGTRTSLVLKQMICLMMPYHDGLSYLQTLHFSTSHEGKPFLDGHILVLLQEVYCLCQTNLLIKNILLGVIFNFYSLVPGN